MPSWLSFDAALQTFVGVPLRSTTEFPDVVDVNITANKSCLESNTTSLSISVDALVEEEDPTLIVEMKWLLPLPQARRRRRQSEYGSNCANMVDGFVRASILEAVAAQARVSVAALSFDIINASIVPDYFDASIVPDATYGSVCQCSAMVMDNGLITCAQARAAKEAMTLKDTKAAMADFVEFGATFSTSLTLPPGIVLHELDVELRDNCTAVGNAVAEVAVAPFNWMALLAWVVAVAVLGLVIAGIVYLRHGTVKPDLEQLFLPRRPTVLGSEQRLARHELEEVRRPVASHDDDGHEQRVPLDGEIPYLAQGPALGPQKGSPSFLGPLRQPPTYRLPPPYTGPHRKRFDGLAGIEVGSNTKMMVTEIITTTTTTRHGHAPAYWSPPDYRHSIHNPGTPVAPSPEDQRRPPPPFVHPPEYLSEHDAVGDTDGDVVGSAVVGEIDGDSVRSAVVGDTDGDSVGSEVVGDTDGDSVGSEVVGDTEADPLDQPRHPDPLKKELMTAAKQLSTEVFGGVTAASVFAPREGGRPDNEASRDTPPEPGGPQIALEDQIATTGDPNAELVNPFMEMDSITHFGHNTFSLAHTLTRVDGVDLEGGYDRFHDDNDAYPEGDAPN